MALRLCVFAILITSALSQLRTASESRFIYSEQDRVCALGMESGAILNEQVTAWSYQDYYTRPAMARFHECGWISGISLDEWDFKDWVYSRLPYWMDNVPWEDWDGLEYLQIDMALSTEITGVATLGYCQKDYAVTEFTLRYSEDEENWKTYKNGTSEETPDYIFIGNEGWHIGMDRSDAVQHTLDYPFVTRYVRIYPVDWIGKNGTGVQHNPPAMRVELFGFRLQNDAPDLDAYDPYKAVLKSDKLRPGPACPRTHFTCSDLSCVLDVFKCDGRNDCPGGEDEEECPSAGCAQFSFECDSRGKTECVSLSFFCDFNLQCSNRRDELHCVYPPCEDNEKRCGSEQCVLKSQVCDGVHQCSDSSDELRCDFCPKGFQCFDGSCLNIERYCDGQIDCMGYIGEDEPFDCDYKDPTFTCPEEGQVRCKNGVCANPNDTCIFNKDNEGIMIGCRDLTHLRPCSKEFVCPINHLQCNLGYCIPQHMRCDGKMDCSTGEDEENCESYECPGAHRCNSFGSCTPMKNRCDGIRQCPRGDDEFNCGIDCPNGCNCEGLAFLCANNKFDVTLDKLTKQLRKLDASNARLMEIELAVKNDVNGTALQNETLLDLSNFKLLGELILRNTSLHYIGNSTLEALANLYYLDLSFNEISTLEGQPFKYLRRLEFLDLSANKIFSVDNGAFMLAPDPSDPTATSKLVNLRLQDNQITEFGPGMFDGLTELSELHSDSYLFICVALTQTKQLDTFSPQPNELSSCEDLIARQGLRVVMWTFASFAILGNGYVIIRRIIAERDQSLGKSRVQNILVLNLGIADFLMGVYQMIIASVDEYYRNVYIWNDEKWRASWLCEFAGFVFVVSSEVSVCSLVLITVDRFISVVFPFKTEWKINVNQAWTMMIAIWAIVAFLGVFPLMGVPYFQDEFYARSGVCLPLHITAERPAGFEFSVAIFMVFNFIAFLLIMGSYIAMFISVRSAGKASGEAAGKQKAGQTQTMTTRMTMIVLTDFFCWFPVTLMGIMALTGVALPGEVFAFTAVIILPINSALNPVLYTVLAIKARGKKKPPGPVPPGGKKPGGRRCAREESRRARRREESGWSWCCWREETMCRWREKNGCCWGEETGCRWREETSCRWREDTGCRWREDTGCWREETRCRWREDTGCRWREDTGCWREETRCRWREETRCRWSKETRCRWREESRRCRWREESRRCGLKEEVAD
ncbi:G-protein coupled receptor GRL101-like [Branchiostoma lanceolatum]|uniref:G-protein coupled receptor GRL101-like n=2 Tax=Branchiostoma lanceolatum TaxID=7740 RepID=UPI003455E9BE